MYGTFWADRMVPLLSGRMSPEQIVERLEAIVAVCRRFYPAVLELGLRRLLAAPPSDGERLIDEGFSLLLELAEPDQRTEEVESVVDNLERLQRFDCSARVLETMVRREPASAEWHDSLAHALVRLEQPEAAAREAAEAVRLAPLDPSFRSNQGWVHLVAGDLEQARAALEAAAELDPAHRIAQGNLAILRYLEEHGGTYLDYLVRPPDTTRIESLAEDGDWEAVDELCAAYDGDRYEAMVLEASASDETQRRKVVGQVSTLTAFFRFVGEVRSDAWQLNEDIEWLTVHFAPLMHKFIFKHGDADPETIEEICAALLEFASFLSAHDLVGTGELRAFRSKLRTLKPGLVRKARRFGQVRHDVSLSEEEKERVGDELFGGDHL